MSTSSALGARRAATALSVAAATIATALVTPLLPAAHADATVTFHDSDRYCEITLTDPHYSLFKIQNYGSMWRNEVARAAIMSWLPKQKLDALKKAREKALHAADDEAADAIDKYQDLHQELADDFAELKHSKGLTPQESDILWFTDPFGPTAGDDWIEPVPPKPGFKYELADLQRMFNETSRTGTMFVFATPSTRPGHVPEGQLREQIHASFDYQVSDIAEGVRVYTDVTHSPAWDSLVKKVNVPDPYTALDARALSNMTWEKWAPVFDDYQRCRQKLFLLAQDGKVTSREVIHRLVGRTVEGTLQGPARGGSQVVSPVRSTVSPSTTAPAPSAAGDGAAGASGARALPPAPPTTGVSPAATVTREPSPTGSGSYSPAVDLVAVATAVFAILTAIAVQLRYPVSPMVNLVASPQR